MNHTFTPTAPSPQGLNDPTVLIIVTVILQAVSILERCWSRIRKSECCGSKIELRDSGDKLEAAPSPPPSTRRRSSLGGDNNVGTT